MVFGKSEKMQPRPMAIKSEPRSAKLQWRRKAVVCVCVHDIMVHFILPSLFRGRGKGKGLFVLLYPTCPVVSHVFVNVVNLQTLKMHLDV